MTDKGQDGSEPQAPDDLVEQLGPMLRPDKREQGIRLLATHVSKTHVGPLPAPEDFAEYEAILPGLADRIVQLTENEQSHRHTCEKRIIWIEFASRLSGQLFAFLALVFLMSVVGFCAYIGQPVAATVMGAVSAMVLGFLRYSSQKNSAEEQVPATQPPKRTRRKKS